MPPCWQSYLFYIHTAYKAHWGLLGIVYSRCILLDFHFYFNIWKANSCFDRLCQFLISFSKAHPVINSNVTLKKMMNHTSLHLLKNWHDISCSHQGCKRSEFEIDVHLLLTFADNVASAGCLCCFSLFNIWKNTCNPSPEIEHGLSKPIPTSFQLCECYRWSRTQWSVFSISLK